LLPPPARQVRFATHDPGDRSNLAYLAASKDASPIVLNRLLCDADVVLPVSLLRPESALLYSGPHGGLCPTFSDTETQQRFRTPQHLTQRKSKQRRREEADEVAWLLGVQLAVQVVAGPGNSLLHVIAGRSEDISDQGRRLVASAWQRHLPQKAELVIASIEGERSEQTWDNFARALYVAQQACCDSGTIVMCTELSREPGPALKRLSGFEEIETLRRRVRKYRSEDAVSAWLLLESRDAAHVYLLSHLDATDVEAMGIGHIEMPSHVARLVGQCDSCILLADAHRASLFAEE